MSLIQCKCVALFNIDINHCLLVAFQVLIINIIIKLVVDCENTYRGVFLLLFEQMGMQKIYICKYIETRKCEKVHGLRLVRWPSVL